MASLAPKLFLIMTAIGEQRFVTKAIIANSAIMMMIAPHCLLELLMICYCFDLLFLFPHLLVSMPNL